MKTLIRFRDQTFSERKAWEHYVTEELYLNASVAGALAA